MHCAALVFDGPSTRQTMLIVLGQCSITPSSTGADSKEKPHGSTYCVWLHVHRPMQRMAALRSTGTCSDPRGTQRGRQVAPLSPTGESANSCSSQLSTACLRFVGAMAAAQLDAGQGAMSHGGLLPKHGRPPVLLWPGKQHLAHNPLVSHVPRQSAITVAQEVHEAQHARRAAHQDAGQPALCGPPLQGPPHIHVRRICQNASRCCLRGALSFQCWSVRLCAVSEPGTNCDVASSPRTCGLTCDASGTRVAGEPSTSVMPLWTRRCTPTTLLSR